MASCDMMASEPQPHVFEDHDGRMIAWTMSAMSAFGKLMTLVHKGGIAKELRDRIQNYSLQDISSKNYDRRNFMPEKRAGMATWDSFVRSLLAWKADGLKQAA